MAAVKTTGLKNITSDAAMVSGVALSITGYTANAPVTIKTIHYGVIATAAGITCGAIALRDGTTELWRGYSYLSAAGAGQCQTTVFPLDATYQPTASINLLHINVTPATASACASVTWY
jgi:hypothetical protein